MMDTLPLWVLAAAYAAHIIEEYCLDWRKWAESISKFKPTWAEFFAVNVAVMALGVSCAIIGFSLPWISYLFVGLAVVNALVAHIGTTIVKRKFSPGLITSISLFLPVGIWAYVKAAEKGILTVPFVAVTLIGGLLIMGIPILFQIVKAKKQY